MLSLIDSNEQPIQGAVVTIYDVNGDLVGEYTTDQSGSIGKVYLTRAIKYSPAMQTPDETYTPHTVVIEANGYPTHTEIYTMDRKREEVVTLQPYNYVNVPSGELTATITDDNLVVEITDDEIVATISSA